MTDLYHAFITHWQSILVGSVFLLAICYICAAAVFAIWAASEERKQDNHRDALDRNRRANEPPRTYPPARGPKGFNRNGRIA